MDLAVRENSERAARWEKGVKVGEGTFANVYKGIERATGRKIAIKKIKVGEMKDGLDMTALREVKFLQELHHPNIIALLDVFSVKQNINLVLEFLDTDLEAVIRDKALIFQNADIKSWIAIWYRPPELLFGSRFYSTAVDMWSIGTIVVELILRVPFLSGETDIDQLKKTFHAMGTPTEQEWPGYTRLPDYHEIGSYPKNPWWNMISSIGKDGQDLVRDMLKFDPLARISARKALEHRFFSSYPRPTPPTSLPKPLAELRPRALAPDETQGKPALSAAGPGAMKRKAESPQSGRSVARKLVFA
ncbi:hypothetical protein I302_106960 [Kwoniella bestiolae CBS 10118]|uniref:[RNA-polymerase]-subunit kinase n=1 Tax=Kwoniella bestiolae CBS 10118 TaxID=1296100 RepID=A0AAJ8KCP9_9TREE